MQSDLLAALRLNHNREAHHIVSCLVGVLEGALDGTWKNHVTGEEHVTCHRCVCTHPHARGRARTHSNVYARVGPRR